MPAPIVAHSKARELSAPRLGDTPLQPTGHEDRVSSDSKTTIHTKWGGTHIAYRPISGA